MDSELQVGQIFLKLNNIMEGDLERLKPHVSKVYFQEGELIFRYGEQVEQLNYLAKGQIKVVTLNSFGQEKTFSVINAGFFLCDPVFFTQTYNYAMVTAMAPCEVWRFSYDYVMDELCIKHPEIALYLLKTISLKMVGMFNHVNELGMKKPKKAIAHFVCHLVESKGVLKTDGNWWVGIKMTHQQIGDFLGLHRVTVTGTLREMKEEGLLVKSTKGFLILDLKKLHALIEI